MYISGLLATAGWVSEIKCSFGVLSENWRRDKCVHFTVQPSIPLEFHNNIHLFFSLLTRKDRGVTVVPISTSC